MKLASKVSQHVLYVNTLTVPNLLMHSLSRLIQLPDALPHSNSLHAQLRGLSGR